MIAKVESHKVSVAPMMDYTDRHFRYLLRLISKRAMLYTEMVTPQAVIFGHKDSLLDFSQEEAPLALQLGGDNPKMLAQVAKMAEERGYSEVNLNVGCPSPRVQKGNFGACLMNSPQVVVDCVKTMQDAVSIPITVKNRIGTDTNQSYANLSSFIDRISRAGVSRFIIHARIAILTGISPKQNRKIPPIRYEDVYNIKVNFPHLNIIINGEVKTIEDIQHHLKKVDGVMIGRASCDNPMLYQHIDSLFYNQQDQNLTRSQIIEYYWDYAIKQQEDSGLSNSLLLRHLSALSYARPKGKQFRQALSKIMSIKKPISIHDLVTIKTHIDTISEA